MILEISKRQRKFLSTEINKIIFMKWIQKLAKKYLTKNIAKTYKKSSAWRITKTKKKVKKLAEQLKIDYRVKRMEGSEAYITVRGHKDGCPEQLCFNPSKSDFRKVSKFILIKIQQKVITSTCKNQWKNSNSVIKWFKSIDNENQCLFIVFDMESFYPSIFLNLFHKTIDFASTI